MAYKEGNNMKDTQYINTEEVLNILDVCSSPYLDDAETKLSDYINNVKTMIIANVSEQKTAHWIHSSVYTDNRGCEFAKCKCSNCGHEEYAISYNVTHGNYCPDCGFYIKGKSYE